MRAGRRFLLGSAGAAGGVALLAGFFARLVPGLTWRGGRGGEGVGWEGPWEVWLLTLFTAGVLALLAAASAWLGQALGGRGAREGLAELRARGARLEALKQDGAKRVGNGVDRERGSPRFSRGGAGGTGGLAEGSPGPAASEEERQGGKGAVPLPAGWFAAVGGWLLLLYAAAFLLGG